MNVQFAIQFPEGNGEGVVYVLEVNPRASRTVPYVSKATGRPLAKIAARCMVGQSLATQGMTRRDRAAVFFGQGSGVSVHQVSRRRHDPRPGNEIDRRSDGRRRYVRRGVPQVAARRRRAPADRRARCSSASRTRTSRARSKSRASWSDWASRWSPRAARRRRSPPPGVPVTPVNKVAEGRPHIVDMLLNDEIALVINTVEEKRSAIQDSYAIRRAALNDQIPTYTTIAGARAAAIGHARHARAGALRDAGVAPACIEFRTSYHFQEIRRA